MRRAIRIEAGVLGLLVLGGSLGLWAWRSGWLEALRVDRSELAASARALRDRHRALADRAQGFDAEAVLSGLGVHPANGEVLRLDEHLDERRDAARTDVPAPAAAGIGVVALELEGDDPLTLELPDGGGWRREDGRIRGVQGEDDYLVVRDVPLERAAIGVIELRLRLREGRRIELGWSPDALDADAPHATDARVGTVVLHGVPDGEFHTYRLDATAALQRRMGPRERIRTFFLRPSDVPGDAVEIDFLRFVPKRVRYAARPVGRAYEVRGRETRPVLYAPAPGELVWDLRVPAREPRLRFGMSVLEHHAPVRFAVAVADAGTPREVFSARVDDPEAWRDATVDLSPWAGRELSLHLRMEGDRDNVAFWSSPVLSGAPSERRNVIVVLEDTLRADRLSLYGHGLPTAPVKEALARRGVVFEHAFSQATKTRPSCPSFMTSLPPSATGVRRHTEMLHEHFLTLAEVMRAQGFTTASFTQNTNAGPAAGLHQGFDQVFQATVHGTRAMYEEAVPAWLREHGDRNFFLYVHVRDPHGAYEPEPPFDRFWRERGPGATPVEPDRRRFDAPYVERPTLEGRRLLYDGEIRQNDHWFERLLAALDRQGLRDDTLLAFLSDHGEHLGERGRWSHNPPGYIQVLRVPLVLVYPDVLPAGLRLPGPVQLMDLMPTLLDLLGIPRDGMLLAGDSLVPRIRGEASERWEQRIAVSEEAMILPGLPREVPSASAFYGRWHLLRSEKVGDTEVYDYHADPQETRPVREPLRERLAAELEPLLADLKASHVRIREGVTGEASDVVDVDPESQDQLRALGYID